MISSAFSPDGNWLAYVSNDSSREEIYVQPFPSNGTKYRISKDRGHHPFWSPDGSELFFVPGPGQFAVVKITTRPTFTFSDPIPLPREWNEGGPTFQRNTDITPDGRIVGLLDASSGGAAAMASVPRVEVVLNWLEELKQRVPTKQTK